MQIIEQSSIPKNPAKKSEDAIIVTDDFIAVIDGSTSKSSMRHSLFCSNGRRCMQLVGKYICKMKKDISCHSFCTGVTAYIRRHYRSSRLSLLTDHPEERMAASAVVYSRVRREVWMIGDCHCLIGGEYYDNPKPFEDILAAKRSAIIKQLIAEGKSVEDMFANDEGRAAILPDMIIAMQEQNKSYSVIDGFPIPESKVRIISLDFKPWEIILASDGYPWLMPSLAESEERLMQQKISDPLNINTFFATKAFLPGNNSFDDRSYIRFKV